MSFGIPVRNGLAIGLGAVISFGVASGPPAAPVNFVPPVISGNTVEGSVLTVTSNGVWTGNPPPTFAYQWQNAGVDILGETASTYTTVAGDVGDAIRCVVTATNSQGSASANSNEITVTAAPVGFSVLGADGTPYSVALAVLGADGTSYTVSSTVLGADGTSYTPI